MPQIIIKKNFSRPDPDFCQGLRDIPTSVLSDICETPRVFDHGLKPMCRGLRIFGPALTVKLGHDSNLLIHKALDLSRPGDVIVVDNGGDCTRSVFGELMSTVAVRKGVAGLVVDGLVRDSDKCAEIGFPIFARGALPRVAGHEAASGSINLPIRCGGAAVEPGDLIVGDDDGIVCVAPAEVPGLLERAGKKLAAEAKRLEDIAAGSHAPAWMTPTLDAADVLYID